MRLLALAMTGGALGAGARFLVNGAAASLLGAKSSPFATLTVNVVGSFAMGLLTAWLVARSDFGADLRIFLGTGFLGGFTTFSAFSLDTLRLAETSYGLAAAYVVASVGLSLLAIGAGYALMNGPRP